ncbi:TPA: AAA family ATPase [Pseudomonas aeruginosa]|nr:AAA family ATPase [Pseudomonas aeruginosa]EKV8099556.1 AAA family ATPase [Pseudomonas aeruginosa]EKW6728681.1 AAA family ATPase [Pseudomonas aeruginosa]MBH4243860.1 AAA family ATPase [Pseudomonas aeruginosa]MBI8504570.1 AAA family ATPase [Pseudomonas aeruginosa]
MARATMKILYGPPGTGKTWRAAREAVRALEPELYSDALKEADPDSALRRLHDSLVADGRILWVTFHPSYSYEDFVEGYRPIVDDAGQLAYRVVDGPFKSLCLRARFETDLQIGEQLTDGAGRPAGIVVEKDAGGWVVRVTPNRSDEVASTIDRYVPRYVIDRVLAMDYPPQIFSIPGKSLLELADYGIDPNDPDVPEPQGDETETTRVGSVVRKIVAARTGMFSSSDLSNSSHYGSVVRRLRELQATGPAAGSSVALVIDEINRAEPSRVFGELLTLLEADKREGMPEEKKIWLPYSKTLFSVPANVSIIGTMNTVDRSLTALDFAMRRRFEFALVPAESELVPGDYGGVDVRALLSRVNGRVTILLGSGYEFGHAFLMEGRLEAIRLSMSWAEESDSRLRTLAHVFKANILPTLAEYFHDDWSRVRAVAGEVRSGTESIILFETPLRDPQFFARLPDEYEFSETKSLTYARWWDPCGDDWDSERFRSFVVALAAGE